MRRNKRGRLNAENERRGLKNRTALQTRADSRKPVKRMERVPFFSPAFSYFSYLKDNVKQERN